MDFGLKLLVHWVCCLESLYSRRLLVIRKKCAMFGYVTARLIYKKHEIDNDEE